MIDDLYKKGIGFAVVFLFVGVGVAPSISGNICHEKNFLSCDQLDQQENYPGAGEGDDDDIVNKIKNGENVTWEEIYTYLEKKLTRNKDREWLYQMDCLIRFYFGDKLSEVFPYTFKLFADFIGSPDMTKKEMFDVFREKVLPLYLQMIPSYNAIEKAIKENIPPHKLPTSVRIPSSINNIANEYYSKYYAIETETLNLIDAVSDYEDYKEYWKISHQWRLGMTYENWYSAIIGFLFLPVLPLLSLGFVVGGIILSLLTDEPVFFFFMTTIGLFLDAVVLLDIVVVKIYEEALDFWNVDMLLHVVDATTEDPVEVGIEIFVQNINASKDDLPGMTDDGFNVIIEVPYWEPEAGAPGEGWYKLSLTNPFENVEFYYPPGYWNISIINYMTKLPLWEKDVPLTKTSIYVKEIEVNLSGL